MTISTPPKKPENIRDWFNSDESARFAAKQEIYTRNTADKRLPGHVIGPGKPGSGA
jgi:hypothetical protein